MASQYRFDDVEIDTGSFRLLKGGKAVQVEPKTLHLLIYLIENRSRLMARREILDAVWPEAFVTDHVLNRTIGQLRKGLGDDAKEPRYIETVPTLGYRFVAQIEEPLHGKEVNEPSSAPSSEVASLEDLNRNGTGMAAPTGPHLPERSLQERMYRKRHWALAIVVIGLEAGVTAYLLQHAISRHQQAEHAVSHPAVERRITSNPAEAPIDAASISPDGKYLAYSDTTGLYLRDIGSGETRPWGMPKNFAVTPNSWFPDGTHLLVTRTEGGSRRPSLWKLSLLGGTPRMLMDNAAAGSVSPDGSRIAYLPGSMVVEPTPTHPVDIHEVGSELWLMDAEGTNPRKIVAVEGPTATVSGNQIQTVTWSPGGQKIAFIERHGLALSHPSVDSFSLRTVSVNGGDLQEVLQDPRLRRALSWAPNARILYTYSEDPDGEQGDQGVRSIPVDESTGKATNQPQPVTHGQGSIGSLSATADGKRFVVSRKNTAPQVFIATFEATSRRWNVLRRVTLDANANVGEAWTPDSKSVFFVSNRHGTWKLFKQAIDETTAEVQVEGRGLFLPRLSADGSQVLYLAYSRQKEPSQTQSVALMRVPLAGGLPQVVVRADGITNHQCARFPSRLCIFSRLAGSDYSFLAFDPEHGAGRVLTRIDHDANWSLSPDGSRLAIFLDDHQVRLLHLNTGNLRDISVKGWPLVNGDWSADGKSLLVQSLTAAGIPVILDVDEQGKAIVVLQGDRNTSFKWLIPSPDGRFGILEADVPGDNNAWMVESF